MVLKHNVQRALLVTGMTLATTLSIVTPVAFADTNYTVTSGDTLWQISQASGATVSALTAANPSINPLNLLIGQRVDIPSQSYTVKSGDVLWKIAAQFGTTINVLQFLNPTMNPNMILSGQVIQVPIATASGTSTPGVVPGSPSTTSSNVAAGVIATAEKLLGTPYVWGGSTTSGFDCSGFTQYVFAQNGIVIPRTSTEQYTVGTPVSEAALQPGDLVFFSDTWKAGISHVGIYLGNRQFIEESSGQGKAIVTTLDNVYYAAHYTGAKRVI